MARSGPIVVKALMPSITLLQISGIASFSSWLIGPITKSTCPPFLKLLPMPMRIRDIRWFRAVPGCSSIRYVRRRCLSLRMRNVPKGRFRSSQMTMRFSIGMPSSFIQYLTALPLRFMYVDGLRSVILLPLKETLAMSPYLAVWNVASADAAHASSTMKPTLCLVSAYSAPMFPSPATKLSLLYSECITFLYKNRTDRDSLPVLKMSLCWNYASAGASAAGAAGTSA